MVLFVNNFFILIGTPGNLERFTERPRKTVRVANSRIVVRRLLFRPITTAHDKKPYFSRERPKTEGNCRNPQSVRLTVSAVYGF